MMFVYLLVQVCCLPFILGTNDKNLGAASSENQYIFWEVYFRRAPKSGKSDIRKVQLYPDLFKDETAAFIIEHSERPTEDVPSRRSIYYWFGKNVSPVLRTETVRYVAYMMQPKYPNIPALISVYRCVSGLEPKEFQMITRRPFQHIMVKKLYKVKGIVDIQIVPVPVTFNELTKMDPFVLITSTYVIIFVPLEADGVKNMRALQFGFYTSDIIYKKEKVTLYIDCRLNFDEQKEQNFNIFLTEIDFMYILDIHLQGRLYSLCNIGSNSDMSNQKKPIQMMSNQKILKIWQEDLELEEKRKNTVQIILFYYNEDENAVKYHYYEKGTRWEDIIDQAISHTLYVTGDENDDRFIYLGSRSVYEEVSSVLQYGETQSENWKTLKIVQNHLDLPVDFIILFPDCWKRFPDVRYVNRRLNLIN